MSRIREAVGFTFPEADFCPGLDLLSSTGLPVTLKRLCLATEHRWSCIHPNVSSGRATGKWLREEGDHFLAGGYAASGLSLLL